MGRSDSMINDPQSYRQLLGVPNVAATLLSRLAGHMFALAIVLFALGRLRSPAGWHLRTAGRERPVIVAGMVLGRMADRCRG